MGALVAIALAVAGAGWADEVGRLAGQQVTLSADGRDYTIDDIAGEGPPMVGVVARRGPDLFLDTGAASYRLTGRLAEPRMAGPGYKIWVVGDLVGHDLAARRLGVLARPR